MYTEIGAHQQYMQITENCDNHKKVITLMVKEGRNGVLNFYYHLYYYTLFPA